LGCWEDHEGKRIRPLTDILLGMVGAVVGGWIFNALGIYPSGGLIASIVVAIVGAVLIIWISRLIKRK
jgi:uncharacterized membrane protein YeaQ/YmgE (transglycosylase-associated protein family)